MAKEKNSKFWIWLLITSGSTLLAVGIAWATLSGHVGHNAETNDKQDILIDKNEQDIDECEKSIIKQTAHYEHILKAIEKIEKKL